MPEREIPKTYDPAEWEEKLYKRWEESGFFNPDVCIKKGVTRTEAKPFSIVLPPPNVTGTLHTGSACMLAIEDLIVRYHRMKGDRTLWIPGTDHAAIATQSKVERLLFEKEGKTRHDLGREEFLKRVEAFAAESRDTIRDQIARMGSSVDWSREAYTLDEKRSLAVRTAFKKMYDDGIIYRGERIVNWDPKMQTTVSDDEIEYVSQKDPFYYFQYGPFVIGTVRPETKFGDKYVVMHPDDERYKEFTHRQKIDLEWINGPITATVIKDEAADMATGSGVMTITPGHSAIDFEIAKRHGLDIERVIDDQGLLLPIAGEFTGKHIAEARNSIVAKLKAKNLVVKIDEAYEHNVATNSRGGGLIEPQLKKQWFIDVSKKFWRGLRKVSLKSLMQEAVRSKKITILPERFEKTYFHWIDNLRDWCISRQIWYGHRIPVWYRDTEVYCGIEAPKGAGWKQDPDTLDTWFSSGLWTFSTLGWPNEEEWVKNRLYHPTALLETGYDIIFFWIARMILMSEYLLKEVPFKTVYLHGLVRDEQGRKMSKSLDNIIDPLDVIKEYGTDALRLALVLGSTPGNDSKIGNEKIAAMRNFVNKLWNMSRYVSSVPDDTFTIVSALPEAKSLADRWILSRLSKLTDAVTSFLEHYEVSLAGEVLRDFTWNEFADWYIEIHKIEKNDAVLAYTFNTLLKLWHPFMPFATEAIYQTVSGEERLLLVEKWPMPLKMRDEEATAHFGLLQELITQVRNIRTQYRIEPKKFLTLSVSGPSFFQENESMVKKLARLETLEYGKAEHIPGTARIVGKGYTAFVHLENIVDIEAERRRLGEEKSNLEKYRASLSARLADPNFTGKAPQMVIDQNQVSLTETEKKISEIDKALASLT